MAGVLSGHVMGATQRNRDRNGPETGLLLNLTALRPGRVQARQFEDAVADGGRGCGEHLDWRMCWEAGSGLLCLAVPLALVRVPVLLSCGAFNDSRVK